MKLLTLGSAVAKLAKSDKAGKGYLSAILYLSPHKSGGYGNICPQASKGCVLSCLNTSGRGNMNSVQKARQRKTALFFENRKEFESLLRKDIESFIKRCKHKKQLPAIRLNGTSDLDWNKLFPTLMTDYSSVQFYDYTKVTKRVFQWLTGGMPSNYHITYSRSEVNQIEALQLLKSGANVAVVFKNNLPKKWHGFTVFNADENDLRFLDKKGVQGLLAKGRAKKDTTGFVIY